MSERVGVIGLGRMGWALAERLSGRGAEVRGWTRSAADTGRAKQLGFEVVREIEELVSASDVLILSLFNDAAVREVLERLAAFDLTGKLIVDTSTVSPKVVREMVDGIRASGGALVDAPISGGPEMVVSGTIGMFVGGHEAAVERFAPIAALVSEKVSNVGPLGAGASAKIINNMVLTGMWEVLSEALETGAGLGLGFETMLGFLEKSPAASNAFLTRLPIIKGESDAVGFSVDGITKDAALVMETSRELGREAPALRAALERFQRMSAEGRGDRDLSTVVPYSYQCVVEAKG